MAVYRQVHVSFWQDPFILDLTPEEKYFYLYLMTNSKTKQCGCYELPSRVMELETGYNRETVEKLLQRFIDYEKIDYCKETKEILIKNWYKYNSSQSPSVVHCIEKEIAEIKHQPFLQYCVDTVGTECTESGGNNNNNKKKKNNKKSGDYSSEFEEWYSSYPRPQAKADTFKSFEKVRKAKGLDFILQCTKNYKKHLSSLPIKEQEYAYSSNNFLGQKAYYLDFEQDKKSFKPKSPQSQQSDLYQPPEYNVTDTELPPEAIEWRKRQVNNN